MIELDLHEVSHLEKLLNHKFQPGSGIQATNLATCQLSLSWDAELVREAFYISIPRMTACECRQFRGVEITTWHPTWLMICEERESHKAARHAPLWGKNPQLDSSGMGKPFIFHPDFQGWHFEPYPICSIYLTG